MKKILIILLFFPSILFSQSWNLIGSNGNTNPTSIYGTSVNDQCGESLEFSSNGERIIVGHPGYSAGNGYARVYEFNNGVWNQLGQDILSTSLNPLTWYFAKKVAISGDGNRIAIADVSGGTISTFLFNNSQWVRTGELQPLGTPINPNHIGVLSTGTQAPNWSGNEVHSISMNYDGSRIAVTDPSTWDYWNNPTGGMVRIYELQLSAAGPNPYCLGHMGFCNGGHELYVPIGQDISGFLASAVSLSNDGNIVAVGAPAPGTPSSIVGAVRVYQYNGSNWIQLGNTLNGISSLWYTDYRLSINNNGTKLVIGSPQEFNNRGQVQIYEYSAGFWVQQGQDIIGPVSDCYKASNATFLPHTFGVSVSLNGNGNVISIGSSCYSRVFQFLNGSWTQAGDSIDCRHTWNSFVGQTPINQFISLNDVGDRVAIGDMHANTYYNWGGSQGAGKVAIYGINSGCTDPSAVNYSSQAVIDDGTCCFISGCTDSTACNYDSLACFNNGTCIGLLGCTDPIASNFNPLATCDDGSCCYTTSSITNQTACNNYIWNGQTYTTSGTYSWLGANAAGCDSTATLNLTINNATSSTNNQTVCYGSSYTINGNTYTSSGTYTDILTGSNGCDSTIITNLTVSSQVIATVSQVGLDLDVSVVGGSTPYSFQWNTTETTQQITPTANGTYWVIAEDLNQCISDTVYFNVTWISTDITELHIVSLSIYPNPSEDIFNITFTSKEKQNLQLRVLNMLGEEIYTENLESFVGNYTKQIMLGKYPDATYLLEIKTSEGIVNKKLMLQ